MGAGAARGPMYPTNLSDDVVWRPTYSSFQQGGRWQGVSTKATQSERCQDGRLQHHGYQGNQSRLLTASFVGWQPRETKCHFLPLYRHMHNHPPFGLSSWISNYSIIKWKSSSRWQSTTTSSLYFWAPSFRVFVFLCFFFFSSFGLTSSASVFLLCRKFYDPIEKPFSFSTWRVWPMILLEGERKPWKNYGQKGPSSTKRTPGPYKADTNLRAPTPPPCQGSFPSQADSSNPLSLCLDSSFKIHYSLKLLR